MSGPDLSQGRQYPKVPVCTLCHDPPARCPLDKSVLQEIRLVHVFQSPGVFRDRSSKGIQPHRPSLEFLDHSQEYHPVIVIQPVFIYIQKVQRIIRHLSGDLPVIFYLGKIPNPLQKAVCQTGRSPGPSRKFQRTVLLDLHIQHTGRPKDNGLSSSFV